MVMIPPVTPTVVMNSFVDMGINQFVDCFVKIFKQLEKKSDS